MSILCSECLFPLHKIDALGKRPHFSLVEKSATFPTSRTNNYCQTEYSIKETYIMLS